MSSVGRLSSLIMRNGWKLVEGALTPLERTKIEALAMVREWEGRQEEVLMCVIPPSSARKWWFTSLRLAFHLFVFNAYMLVVLCMTEFLFSCFQLSLWLRDILDDLCHRKLRDVADFEWQRFPRPYLDPEPGNGNEAANESPTHQLVLKCLNTRIEYGWEYLGCEALPVFTPRTDNYIIAFTQVE